MLQVNGRRWYINHLPPAFGHYVWPGDSIVKQASSLVVTSYRLLQGYLVRASWQYAVRNGYKQPLLTKYYVQPQAARIKLIKQSSRDDFRQSTWGFFVVGGGIIRVILFVRYLALCPRYFL